MARKPKQPAKDDDKVKASDLMLMPPTTTIKSLRAERAKALKTSRNATSTYGQQVSEAVEKKHVDKKALGIALSLDDMPDEKLAITLPHLLRYIDDLGLEQRATKQAELFQREAENEDEEDEGEGKADGGKVTRIGAAARRVIEEAGAQPSGD